MAKKYTRKRAASDALGYTKTPRKIKKRTARKRRANRKQLLNVGSNLKYPKSMRLDALIGARRLR